MYVSWKLATRIAFLTSVFLALTRLLPLKPLVADFLLYSCHLGFHCFPLHALDDICGLLWVRLLNVFIETNADAESFFLPIVCSAINFSTFRAHSLTFNVWRSVMSNSLALWNSTWRRLLERLLDSGQLFISLHLDRPARCLSIKISTPGSLSLF